MNELADLMDEDGSCVVDGFTIGRYDFGNVYFPDRFNVAGLDLDSIGELPYFYNSNFFSYFVNFVLRFQFISGIGK